MSALAVAPADNATSTVRQIVHRSRGQTHGPITRLMSPGDLGEVLKPFVFLDLFDNGGKPTSGFGLHPHSGIATLTYIAEGSVGYEDTNGAKGVLEAGAVEWMQAGGGVWHGGGGGRPGRTRGFQLWIALPPNLELGPSTSLYQSAVDVPVAGPARVLLGSQGGALSAIAAPAPINYFAVTLGAGERWTYQPPHGHGVLWIAAGRGQVATPDVVAEGEIAVFEPGRQAVEFVGRSDAEFVVGSAAPHDHELVLGYYSVHTSPEALLKGEANIQAIRRRLVQQGRLPD
jgi:redox-sensitive bicupin YhaK (pirin superfamily)